MPRDNYYSIGLKTDVSLELRKLQGQIQGRNGRRITFSDLVALLIEAYQSEKAA
jgi:hypothetical protein